MSNSEPPSTLADTSEPGDQSEVPGNPTKARDRKGFAPGPEVMDRNTVGRLADDRAGAVADTAGALTGTYEPRELERLREDWPD